jgi:beta-phosphoglucomutase-like phosphatase (HAD superfamily)
LKAILVDLDGTLVDSHAANMAAYATAIGETGIIFDTHLLKQTVGRLAWPEMLARVLPGRPDLYEAIIIRKREIYAGLFDIVAVNDMLLNFLCAFHGRVPIGLVTSASRISVDSLLRAKSLECIARRFEALTWHLLPIRQTRVSARGECQAETRDTRVNSETTLPTRRRS